MLTQVTSIMGPGGASALEDVIVKLEQLKGLIDMVIIHSFVRTLNNNMH